MRFQFVWWGWFGEDGAFGARWFKFYRYAGNIAKVYRWSYSIGPLEIRRWAP